MYISRPALINELGSRPFKLRTLSAIIMGICVSSQAFANKNDDQTIDAITVYGEKVERSIYDTGSSIQVYDEETIVTTPAATEADDLWQLTPNIVDSGQGNNAFSIRGVDSSGPSIGGLAAFGGSTPRFSLSIDGRSLDYSELAFGSASLWDMQQAEIYLGPQSYVQGRNASAGAMVLKSNDPTYEFEAKVKAAIGQQNLSQTAAVISAPIIDEQLAFRLSVDEQKRSSYADRPVYDEVGDPNRVEMTTIRGKFLFEPSGIPEFRTTLTVSDVDSRSPQIEAVSDDFNAIYETQSTSAIWDAAYEISDALVFENNLMYTERSFDRTTDPDYAQRDVSSEGSEFHIEPIVHFNSERENVSGLVGLRYFNSDTDDAYETSFSTTPMTGENETVSAFAEVTYAVTPSIEIVVASRIEHENKVRYIEDTTYAIDYDETSTVFLPKLELAYKPEKNQTLGVRASRGFSSGGAGVGFDSSFAFSEYEYDDEYVWNYELFTRHSFSNDTIELTSNIFYNDFDGYQVVTTDATNNDFISIVNIDDVSTYGAELGSRWLTTSNLELSASVGWLKTEYVDSDNESKELPRASSFTATLQALYTFAEHFEVSGNANYTGGYYSDVENTESEKIDAYWVANAQLSYVFNKGRFTLFATNLLDAGDDTYNLDGTITELAPRQIGGSVELSF